MSEINEKVLDSRLAALESARNWSPRLVAKLENHLRGGADEALFRINPHRFAADKGTELAETIDLFLHATALDIVTMDWLMVCPGCGAAVESLRSLQTIHNSFHCAFCDMHHQTALDDYIVIAFTVSPSLRDIAYHHPENLSAEDYSFRYRWTDLARMQSGRAIPEALKSATERVDFIAPGETIDVVIEAGPGAVLNGWSVDGAARFHVRVDGKKAVSQTVPIRFTLDSCDPAQTVVAPGTVRLQVENIGDKRGIVGVAQFHADAEPMEITPGGFAPFLSGKKLVTTQTFRDLFRTQVVGGSEGIGVKDVTLLFTDLKGSTALYERIGDLTAFSLVQQHFGALRDVTAKHGGAVVKTIGDAVMAAFAEPEDAVRAALAMLREIDEFNHAAARRDLVLKIGIHRGPAIAVTLNEQLDYFGQTVNIAARVQGLAEAAEIYLTRDVRDAEGVTPLLDGIPVGEQNAHLKGIGEEMTVFRISPAA